MAYLAGEAIAAIEGRVTDVLPGRFIFNLRLEKADGTLSQEVPLIQNDGTFHFFTSPLPNGENLITITAQNAKGGVATQTKKVVIQ